MHDRSPMIMHLMRFLLFVALPLALATLSVLISYFILHSWWLELLSFCMPLILVGGFLLFAASLRWGTGWMHRWSPLLLCLVLIKPLRETVALNFRDSEEAPDVTVMSFNAALFNPYRSTTLNSDSSIFEELYAFLRHMPAPDILCIQEFYHAFNSASELTADSILQLGGYSYFHTNPRYDEDYQGLVGVATFSRFPALANGKLDLGDDRYYTGHWNDFLVNGDTLRVVNIQLQSMSIRWRPREGGTRYDHVRGNLRRIHDRLRWGYERRQEELTAIEDHLRNSPYPLILCADINALPYSDTYQRLKLMFDNAFERRGRGFGFTYHHFPWFIRIDNQFHSRELGVSYFRTRTDIEVSDHFPIEAGYVLPGSARYVLDTRGPQ